MSDAGASRDRLSEADLLAWVEGELPEDRRETLARALADRPSLARWLEAMRRDRAALASMPIEEPPAGLLDAAEAALEREALVGLSDGRAMIETLPVSAVPARRAWSTARPDRAVGRWALAAAAVVIAGGAAVVAMLPRGTRPPAPVAPLALDLPGPTPIDADATSPVEVAPLAAAAEPEGAIPAGATDEPAAAIAAVEPGTPAAEEPAPMPIERAVDLARQGRLALRVQSLDVSRSAARVRALADAPAFAWRIDGRASGAMAFLLDATPGRRSLDRPVPQSPALAGGDGVTPPGWSPDDFRGPVAASEGDPGVVIVVSLPCEPGALAAMQRALAPGSESAAFVELEQAIPDAGDVLEPEAMLWWGQPPSRWAAWRRVPIIIAP